MTDAEFQARLNESLDRRNKALNRAHDRHLTFYRKLLKQYENEKDAERAQDITP